MALSPGSRGRETPGREILTKCYYKTDKKLHADVVVSWGINCEKSSKNV